MDTMASCGVEQVRVENAAVRHDGSCALGAFKRRAIPPSFDGDAGTVVGALEQAFKSEKRQLPAHARAQRDADMGARKVRGLAQDDAAAEPGECEGRDRARGSAADDHNVAVEPCTQCNSARVPPENISGRAADRRR